MSKLYDTLLAPEWRIAISPKDAGDTLLRGLRTITSRLASLVKLDLSAGTVRPFYGVINVGLDDIEYVNALASADHPVLANRINAGEVDYIQLLAIPNKVAKYRFKSDTTDIDAFGVGITKHIALVGRDFFYKDGYYWFTEHPSKFGSIDSTSGSHILTLPCLGGAQTTAEMPVSVACQDCADVTVLNAVEESVHGSAPNGVTNALLYAIGGMSLSNEIVQQAWEEENYYLGITKSGKFVYAPKASGVKILPEQPIYFGKLFSPGDYFIVPTSLDNYVIVVTESYTTADFPGILADFPQLGTNFTGVSLLAELYKRGCVFYTLSYINNATGAQQTLSHFIINPGKVIITTEAAAENTVRLTTLPPLPSFTVTSTDTSGTTNII